MKPDDPSLKRLVPPKLTMLERTYLPQILGGPSSRWFTQIIYRTFFESVNWPRGAAYAVILLVAVYVTILRQNQGKKAVM